MPGPNNDRGVNTVSLLQAVFCVDCETVSDSAQHACAVCGSPSVVSLFRLLGGSLRGQKAPANNDSGNTNKYELELTVRVREIPAGELNDIIQFLSHLAEVGGEVERLHINVQSAWASAEARQAAA